MPTRRPAFAVITGLIGLTLLTACVPSGPEPEPTATSTPTVTPDASSTPTPTPSPTDEIIPFSADCNTLITPAVMYTFDPNLSPFGAFTPDAGKLPWSRFAPSAPPALFGRDTLMVLDRETR